MLAQRLIQFGAVVALAGCATWGKSTPCRDLYNACLNACPKPPPPPQNGAPNTTFGNSQAMEIASCASRCEGQLNSCR